MNFLRLSSQLSSPIGWNGDINTKSSQYTNLLAWWPLRRDLADRVYNVISRVSDPFATGVRSPAWVSSSTVGQSLVGVATAYNDANGDHVPVTSVACGTLHTISFWCKYNNYGGQSYGGIPLGGSSTSYIDWINGSARRYAAGGVSVDITSTIAKGAWNHHCWARNGTSVTAYLNGRQDGSPGTLGANNALTIAYLMSNSQYFLSGNISDVRIYNRILGASEIFQLYDPVTRWELYQPSRPMMWWIPPVTGSIIPRVRHHMAQQGMA